MKHRRYPQIVFFSLFFLALAVGGCNSGGGGGGAGAPPIPSAVVGPEGGTLTSPDGRLKLEIPAGALSNAETITIESIDPAALPPELQGADLAWDLKPDGLQFAQPVQVVVTAPETPKQPDGSLQVAVGSLLTSSGSTVEALGNQTMSVNGDTNQTTIAGTLTHFSSLVRGTILRTKNDQPVFDPTHPDKGKLFVGLTRPLPLEMDVGPTYRATLSTYVNGFLPNEVISADFSYKDFSSPPLEHKPETTAGGDGFFPLGRMALPMEGTKDLPSYGDYVCTQPGGPFYQTLVRITPTISLTVLNTQILLQQALLTLDSTHTCKAPSGPPPPPPPASGGAVVHPLLRGAEGMFRFVGLDASAFGLQTLADSIAVPTTNPGLHIVNLTTGQIERSKDLPGAPQFGVVPHLKDGRGCLFGIGVGTPRSCFFPEINDFGFSEIAPGAVGSDGGLLSPTPVQEPSGLRHLLWWVENGVLHQEIQPGGANTAVQQRKIRPQDLWYSNGTATGTPKSAAFNADASKVVVVRGQAGQPGQLWFGDPAVSGTLIGSLSANSHDTRKIRCERPICAVSNRFGLVSIVTWDGTNPPAIVGPIPGSAGSVGIDVVAEGNNQAIRHADFDNNTVTKTIVDPAGRIVSSVTKPAPQGCTNPGHVISLADALDGQLKTVVSCNGVNAQGQSAIAVLTDSIFFASP